MYITLLTDFGTEDGYTGAMKGVILSICPAARIIDITHRVGPQAVEDAAFVIGGFHGYFPAGTVHCAVVDPGVGTGRNPLVVSAGGYIFVAPDNGLLSYVFHRYPGAGVWIADRQEFFRRPVSDTFHGRDIFAPVAAHAAAGTAPDQLGTKTSTFIRGHVPQPAKNRNDITGEIVYIDRFGNCVTNIPASDIHSRDAWVIAEGRDIGPLRKTYADADQGTPLALFGSFGTVEIAVNRSSAAQELNLRRGALVRVVL